eukprot:6492723-Amphidinium_carterae.1
MRRKHHQWYRNEEGSSRWRMTKHHQTPECRIAGRGRVGSPSENSDCLQLVTANVTSWGSLCKQEEAWRACGAEPDIVCVQEHHRRETHRGDDTQWLWRRGYRWHMCVGVMNGGVGIAIARHIGSTMAWSSDCGRALACHVNALVPKGFYCISTYLQTGVPLRKQNQLLQTIARLTLQLPETWVMAGDFQAPPSEMREVEWPSLLHAGVIDCGEHTCDTRPRRELDYFLASPTIVSLVRDLRKDGHRLTRPHHPLRLSLNRRPEHPTVPVLKRNFRCPEVPLIGPQLPQRDWNWTANSDVCVQWRDWLKAAKQWLSFHHGVAFVGKEACVTQVPLAQFLAEQEVTHSDPEVLAWQWFQCRIWAHIGHIMGVHAVLASVLRGHNKNCFVSKAWQAVPETFVNCLSVVTLRGTTMCISEWMLHIQTAGWLELVLLASEVTQQC